MLKTENGSKNEELRQKKRKPINKLRIKNFFWRPEKTQKMRKRTHKLRGNRSKTENLKLILKTRNGPKNEEYRTQKKRKPITNWEFKTFFETWRRTQKKRQWTNWEFKPFSENRKRTQKLGNGPEKRGNRSTNCRI